jgi:CHRD domain-containing protein
MRSAMAVGSMVLMMAGCGYDRSNGVAYPADTPISVTLSAPSTDPLVSAGDTRVVTAVVRTATGVVVPSPSLSWRTSSPSVATVVGSGSSATVTAVDDGNATITAADGSTEGTITITVRRRVVSIELSAPDSVVVAGFTTQLTVTGRDARRQPINGLSGATFQSSNAFSIQISPTGLVTALYSSVGPFDAIVTALLTRDGVTLSATKRFDVGDPAPAGFQVFGWMSPEEVRPDAPLSAGDGIVYLTRDGDRVQFKILWSLLSGPPASAHIHGPDQSGADTADVLVELPLGTPSSASGTLSGSFSAADIRSPRGAPPISLDSLFTLLATPAATYVDIHSAVLRSGEIRGPIYPRS